MGKGFFEHEWKALGTDIGVQIVMDDEIEQQEENSLLSEIKNIYSAQEMIFSRFNKQSELSILNTHLGEFREASADMLCLAKKAINYFRESEGIFDPRVLENLERIGYVNNFKDNSFIGEVDSIEDNIGRELEQDLIIENKKIKFLCRMDFAGIAKGYITDKVSEFLRGKGFRNFLVDSGGDMYAAGYDRDGDSWGIALEGAKNEEEVMVEISDRAIATSGNVRRNWKRGEKKFHHLINPYQPNNFSFAVQSVSVVEESLEKADVWAKVLFLLGQEKGMEKAREKNLQAYFLQLDGEVIKSEYI